MTNEADEVAALRHVFEITAKRYPSVAKQRVQFNAALLSGTKLNAAMILCPPGLELFQCGQGTSWLAGFRDGNRKIVIRHAVQKCGNRRCDGGVSGARGRAVIPGGAEPC